MGTEGYMVRGTAGAGEEASLDASCVEGIERQEGGTSRLIAPTAGGIDLRTRRKDTAVERINNICAYPEGGYSDQIPLGGRSWCVAAKRTAGKHRGY